MVSGASLLDTFRYPAGMCVDTQRKVFVVLDEGNDRLAVFGAEGRFLGQVSEGSLGRQRFGDPVAVATDHRGRLFLADGQNDRIHILSPAGSRVASVDLEAFVGPEFHVRSLAVGESGRVYVLFGGGGGRVVVLESGGVLAEGLGLLESVPELASATSVAVNESESEIAVTAPLAVHQVSVYDLDGRLLASFGEEGEGDGTFSLAAHVSWGPENTLWITDTLRHSISVFDSRGGFLGRIGGFGRGPGQFRFPVASGFLAGDRLVVLERGNGRCQILETRMTVREDQLALDRTDLESAPRPSFE